MIRIVQYALAGTIILILAVFRPDIPIWATITIFSVACFAAGV